MRTKTEILIKAMRILSNDIVSEDGIANAAIAEAAGRIESLNLENGILVEKLEAMAITAHRYEKIRRFSPEEFGELWNNSLIGSNFDFLLDEWPNE